MNSKLTRRSFVQAAAATAVACTASRGHAAAEKDKPRIPAQAVIPAALTPFDADRAVDRKAFRRHLEALSAVVGVSAIMVNGAAGQDGALSRDERRMLIAEAQAAVGARTPILAALREAKDATLAQLAKDAAAEGAPAFMLMPPRDKAGAAWEGAQKRCREIFDAAPGVPLAIYQTVYGTQTLEQLAALEPVFAIKEGNGDPATFERNLRAVRALGRPVAVWSTHSRWLLADLAVGADGILSGMGSIAADLQVALAQAMWRLDLAAARKVNDRLFPLTQAFYRPGGDPHTRMKYALKRLGRWESDAVRPTLTPVGEDDRARIDLALKVAGLEK